MVTLPKCYTLLHTVSFYHRQIKRDKKTICLAVFFSSLLKSSILPAEKDRDRVGKAATENASPIIPRGTDCKFRERLKIEMEPPFKNEASDTMRIRATLLKERPKVLGNETAITFRISLKLIAFEKRGVNPQRAEVNA